MIVKLIVSVHGGDELSTGNMIGTSVVNEHLVKQYRLVSGYRQVLT